MGALIYAAITSLDGYVADRDGSFDWAAPDEPAHALVNDLLRPAGTHLYGRRTYDVMTAWEDMPLDGAPDVIRDFAALWRGADKVVYSRTLTEVGTARTRLEYDFDPQAVAARTRAGTADVSIGGPGLAAEALCAGLVDDVHQLVHPVVVGGGTSWLPSGLRLDLDLVDEQRLSGGVVHLHYRPRR